MINSYDDEDGNIESHKLKLFKQGGVWFRIPHDNGGEVGDKPKELRKVLYAYTHKYNPSIKPEQRNKLILEFEKNMSTDFEDIHHNYTTDSKTCIFSCSKCKALYHILHKETHEQFAVGSS